jgi:hypothetical protein
LVIERAGTAEYQQIMTILREAADWLSSRANPQWRHWHTDFGERMLRERIEHHETYLVRRDTQPVATLAIHWSDPEQWGERGLDGLAGYIHGVAITRRSAENALASAYSNGPSIESRLPPSTSRVSMRTLRTRHYAVITKSAAFDHSKPSRCLEACTPHSSSSETCVESRYSPTRLA